MKILGRHWREDMLRAGTARGPTDGGASPGGAKECEFIFGRWLGWRKGGGADRLGGVRRRIFRVRGWVILGIGLLWLGLSAVSMGIEPPAKRQFPAALDDTAAQSGTPLRDILKQRAEEEPL